MTTLCCQPVQSTRARTQLVVKAVRQTSLREMTERQYGPKSTGSSLPRKVVGKCSVRSVEPAPLVLDASKQASQIMPFNLAQKPELAAMVAKS